MKHTIKSWAEDDRPREKLLAKGAKALSHSELVAIIINNGTQDESAVQVAQKLLAAVNNDLNELAKLSIKGILNLHVKGIGPAKAIAVKAALEMGLRRDVMVKKPEFIRSSSDAAEFLKAQFQYYQHEVFVVMYVNRQNKVLLTEIVSEGGISGTVVDVRLIFKKALEYNASSILLCHNHPGGGLTPSSADVHLTKKIKSAAALLEMDVMDHIIVSENGYYSFADEGIL